MAIDCIQSGAHCVSACVLVRCFEVHVCVCCQFVCMHMPDLWTRSRAVVCYLLWRMSLTLLSEEESHECIKFLWWFSLFWLLHRRRDDISAAIKPWQSHYVRIDCACCVTDKTGCVHVVWTVTFGQCFRSFPFLCCRGSFTVRLNDIEYNRKSNSIIATAFDC